MSVMFIVPMNAPGLKLICRASYEETASRIGSALRLPAVVALRRERRHLGARQRLHPLGGRAACCATPRKILSFHPGVRACLQRLFASRAARGFAVKLDFITGLLAKALRAHRRRGLPRRPGARSAR